MDGDPSSASGSTSHLYKQNNLHAQDESNRLGCARSIPDDVLLDIFDFYRNTNRNDIKHYHPVWKWHILVHVCRRWRQVVFASPHRLNLQILCTDETPVSTKLSIWPAFPIFLYYEHRITPDNEDNAITVLEHPDRVCSVRLKVSVPQLRKMATVMQKPFPVLTLLDLSSEDCYRPVHLPVPVLPAEFLGGSAPCLQEISLSGIPFPASGTLLLSTNVLVKLDIRNIPLIVGYISPEAMVACLAKLPRLNNCTIGFQSANSRPDQIRPPPLTRIVLPALTSFRFEGASEYLEDLVAQIDCPQLNRIDIEYLNEFVDFRVPQLDKFINRLESIPFECADVNISTWQVTFTLSRYRHAGQDRRPVRTTIHWKPIEWHVFHISQLFSQFSATLSNVVHLKLRVNCHLDFTDDDEWLHLLHRFSAVQLLYLSPALAWRVAITLEDIAAEMVNEVLPSLDLICLEAKLPSSVEKFVAARRLSNRPVTVVETEKEFDERLELRQQI